MYFQPLDSYRFVREETLDGQECFVVERYPLYENSGYAKQVVWWDRTEYRIQRIDFYDRKDSLLKTLTYHDYKLYRGRYWRPDRMSMHNHQNHKSTELLFLDGRSEDAPVSLFDNDVFLGFRYAFNDIAGTTILGGPVIDADTGEVVAFLESERRIGERWVAALESRWMMKTSADTPLHGLRRDDSVTLRLNRYF